MGAVISSMVSLIQTDTKCKTWVIAEKKAALGGKTGQSSRKE